MVSSCAGLWYVCRASKANVQVTDSSTDAKSLIEILIERMQFAEPWTERYAFASQSACCIEESVANLLGLGTQWSVPHMRDSHEGSAQRRRGSVQKQLVDQQLLDSTTSKSLSSTPMKMLLTERSSHASCTRQSRFGQSHQSFAAVNGRSTILLVPLVEKAQFTMELVSRLIPCMSDPLVRQQQTAYNAL